MESMLNAAKKFLIQIRQSDTITSPSENLRQHSVSFRVMKYILATHPPRTEAAEEEKAADLLKTLSSFDKPTAALLEPILRKVELFYSIENPKNMRGGAADWHEICGLISRELNNYGGNKKCKQSNSI